MKTLILLASLIGFNAYAGAPKGAKSCAEHLQGTYRTCIDVMEKSTAPGCTNIIKSGEKWVDEFSMNAMDELYTTDKQWCDYVLDTVDFAEDGSSKEYCCGG